jgi:hypothetical protein
MSEWHAGCVASGNLEVIVLKLLVDALNTNPDAARWPVVDRLIELRDAGLIAPEVWRLVMALSSEYEAEIKALRERPLS